MEESGQVISVRHGREKHFRVRATNWQFLLPLPTDGQSAFPRWVDWMPLFAAITRPGDTFQATDLHPDGMADDSRGRWAGGRKGVNFQCSGKRKGERRGD
jgi:hypothetical protein